MNVDTLEKDLAQVENNADMLRMAGIAVFDSYLPVLCGLSTANLAGCLMRWSVDSPSALSKLLEAVAQSDEASDAVTWALCRVLSQWYDEGGPTDDVLRRALPRIPAPQRDWIAERLGLDGFPIRQRSEIEADAWPEDVPLPPGDTVAGLQARLKRFDLYRGPVTGVWDQRTRDALSRFQYESYHEDHGAVDEETLELLGVDPEAIERAERAQFRLI